MPSHLGGLLITLGHAQGGCSLVLPLGAQALLGSKVKEAQPGDPFPLLVAGALVAGQGQCHAGTPALQATPRFLAVHQKYIGICKSKMQYRQN